MIKTRFIIHLIFCLLIIPASSVNATSRLNNTIEHNHFDNKPPYPLNKKLLNLVPNKWSKFTTSSNLKWHRQAHSGIAYDSKRGNILLFGSDTHGSDWDNSVHEFNPFTEKWDTHYPASGKNTYRITEEGIPVAGTDESMPWAMHTFDNIVYDPLIDAIIVTALPEHNPVKKQLMKNKSTKLQHATWFYHLKTRKWSMLKPEKGTPKFFAASSDYDSDRNVVTAYKQGIWELDKSRSKWLQATRENHHKIHHTMVYDSINKKFAVFGNYGDTNIVWLYTPGNSYGIKGTWEKRIPMGDVCPEDQHFPVAFDNINGVFLLVPDNIKFKQMNPKWRKRIKAKSSNTFIYNIKTNLYKKVPDSDFPPLHMNYMMVYDRFHNVFLLITGERNKPVTVWALKLDLEKLDNSN